MKRKLLVVGGGTAGLISAITLIRQCPNVALQLIRSKQIGHIMVGEGTVGTTPHFFHEILGIPKKDFYQQVKPTWKLGVRFLWGTRPYFDYTFTAQFCNQILPSSNRPLGYYFSDCSWEGVSAASEAMNQHKLLCDAKDLTDKGLPREAAYHFENHLFVEYLEKHFVKLGGVLTEGKLVSTKSGENGIESITLESGEVLSADFFVDASGFSGELIHKTLKEPYVSMSEHLFCDKAIVGGWERGNDEPIKPYTTAETMNAGWCWQIEHEKIINRGYVHSSDFLSEDQAAAEFLSENPKLNESELRTVPFESRYIKRPWVKNVLAIGNACGFVEPLEATNIQVICTQALRFAQTFNESVGISHNQTLVDAYNESVTNDWIVIRDFLALHYKFNTRLNTPFWNKAVSETPLASLEDYIGFYKDIGPSELGSAYLNKADSFGLEGYLTMLIGMNVEYAGGEKVLSDLDRSSLKNVKQSNMLRAMAGCSSEELLSRVRGSGWSWSV